MSAQNNSRRARWILIVSVLALLAAVVLLWRFSPLAKFAQPRELVAHLTVLADSPFAPAAMIGLFVVGGLVSFPLLVLITATAMLFQPLSAFCIALSGGVASAVVTYLVAAKLLRNKVAELLGARIEKLSAVLQQQGVLAVAAVRMLPVGPFTFVNLAAGSIGLRMRDYVLGTALGLAPGIAAITAFGAQLRQIIDHPSAKGIGILVAIVVAWIAASFALQHLVSGRQRRGV